MQDTPPPPVTVVLATTSHTVYSQDVYIFDNEGQIRLLASGSEDTAANTENLRKLIRIADDGLGVVAVIRFGVGQCWTKLKVSSNDRRQRPG